MRFDEINDENKDDEDMFSREDLLDLIQTVQNPGTMSKPVPLSQLRDMLAGMMEAKPGRPEPAAEMPYARHCKLFWQTLKEHINLVPKLTEFLDAKMADPGGMFTNKDSPFIAKGPIGSLLGADRQPLKIKHAHLTQDVSVVYSVRGKPAVIDLYGLFRHKELGTGGSTGIKIQQSMAKKLGGQQFEPLGPDKFTNIHKKG